MEEPMELVSMPAELLIRIIQDCDFTEIGRICATCKRLKECADSEAVWRYKWEKLLEHGPFVISLNNITGRWHYKEICERYVSIQRQACANNNMAAGWRPSTPPCLRECVGWCIYCNQEGLHMAAHQKPDVLALDFGSKTSWVRCNKGSWSCLVSTRTPTRQVASIERNTPRQDGCTNDDQSAEPQGSGGCRDQQLDNGNIAKDLRRQNSSPSDSQTQYGQIIEDVTNGATLGTLSLIEKSQHYVKCENSGESANQTFEKSSISTSEIYSNGRCPEGNESSTCNGDEESVPQPWSADIYPQGALLCTCILCDPRIRASCKPCRQGITPPQSCLHMLQSKCNKTTRSVEIDERASSQARNCHSPPGLVADLTGQPHHTDYSHVGSSHPAPEIETPATGQTNGSTPSVPNYSYSTENSPPRRQRRNSYLNAATFVPPVPATCDLWRLVRRLLEKTGGSSSICLSRAICQVCEPTGWDDFHKRALLKMFFKELGIQSLCFVPKASCIAMATGLDCCLVVDSGAHYTTVTAVVDQRVVRGFHRVRQVGGAHISQCLTEVLSDKGLSPKLCACELDGQEVKSKCYVEHRRGIRSQSKLAPVDILVRSLRHAGGWAVAQLTHELYMAPEIMYLTLDLPSMIKETISKLPPDLQKKLVANIMLTGGNCGLTGFASRLQLDLQSILTDLAPWVWVRIRDAYICLRSDAVEGVSYLPKPCESPAKSCSGEGFSQLPYVSREDYIIHGEVECLKRMKEYWEMEVC